MRVWWWERRVESCVWRARTWVERVFVESGFCCKARMGERKAAVKRRIIGMSDEGCIFLITAGTAELLR